MEAITKQYLNFSREDDENLLSKKIYKNIYSANKQQTDQEIKESTLSNLRLEDDAEKIIDNLITNYESKLNAVVIQNDNFLKSIGFATAKIIKAEEIKIIKESSTYNTILVSWNYLVRLLSDAKKLPASYPKLKLRLNDLNMVISKFLEISIVLFNNLAFLDVKPNPQINPLYVQLMKLYSISDLIRNQILDDKFKKISFDDVLISYDELRKDPLILPSSREKLNEAERRFNRPTTGLAGPFDVLNRQLRQQLVPPKQKVIPAQSSKGQRYDDLIKQRDTLSKKLSTLTQAKAKKATQKKIDDIDEELFDIDNENQLSGEDLFTSSKSMFSPLMSDEDLAISALQPSP